MVGLGLHDHAARVPVRDDAAQQGRQLSELDAADVAEVAPQLGDEGLAPVFAGGWLDTKVSQGGTALERVREQLDRARAAVAGAPR